MVNRNKIGLNISCFEIIFSFVNWISSKNEKQIHILDKHFVFYSLKSGVFVLWNVKLFFFLHFVVF